MFNEENLERVAGDKESIFAIWRYTTDGIHDASAARNQLGFFPVDGRVKRGDAIYITDGSATTHHYMQFNANEGKLMPVQF